MVVEVFNEWNFFSGGRKELVVVVEAFLLVAVAVAKAGKREQRHAGSWNTNHCQSCSAG